MSNNNSNGNKSNQHHLDDHDDDVDADVRAFFTPRTLDPDELRQVAPVISTAIDDIVEKIESKDIVSTTSNNNHVLGEGLLARDALDDDAPVDERNKEDDWESNERLRDALVKGNPRDYVRTPASQCPVK